MVWMDRSDPGISCKIAIIERDDVGDAMNAHGRNQTSVVYLNAHHRVRHDEPTPLGMHPVVVGK